MFISGALGMEVELYRASDGSHLGSFSHETGLQVGPIQKIVNLKSEGSTGLKIRLDWYDKRTELGLSLIHI